MKAVLPNPLKFPLVLPSFNIYLLIFPSKMAGGNKAGSSPRARHPGMRSQVGLRKHHTNKVSGGDGIPVELFQILKDDAVKLLQSVCQQIWKTQQWPQDWKRSVFIPVSKKGNTKECSNYHTIALILHASKVMVKILQATFQQYVNFKMFKLDLEKAEEPEVKLPTSVES